VLKIERDEFRIRQILEVIKNGIIDYEIIKETKILMAVRDVATRFGSLQSLVNRTVKRLSEIVKPVARRDVESSVWERKKTMNMLKRVWKMQLGEEVNAQFIAVEVESELYKCYDIKHYKKRVKAIKFNLCDP
jgi:hypothetical protein